MQRFKTAGLCLVAVSAFSVFTASGAQAGQIGKCVKAAKNGKAYTGKYTDKLCATHATKAEEEAGKTNKYEWVPNAGSIPFASEGGASHWKTAAGEFGCERLTDTGTFEGATKDKDTLTFMGCKLKPFELVCGKEGKIVTNELASQLIDHGEKGPSGKEPAEGEVWEMLTNNGIHMDPVFGSGPWLASFECGGVPFALSGSISGFVEARYVNAKLKKGKAGKETSKGHNGKPTFQVEYAESAGEQDLQATFVNPLNENKVESGPMVLAFNNEVIISAIEKGFEIGGAEGE